MSNKFNTGDSVYVLSLKKDRPINRTTITGVWVSETGEVRYTTEALSAILLPANQIGRTIDDLVATSPRASFIVEEA